MNDHNLHTIESETGFKALFENATVGIIVVNSEGVIELTNPNLEGYFEYSKEELIGQHIEMLIPETFRTRHTLYQKGYFKNPKTRSMGVGMNLFAVKKNGDEFPVEISLGHYNIGDKQMAVAFVTNITEKKVYIEALKASEEKYRNIYQNSLVSMYTIEFVHSKIIEVNDFTVQFYGYASKSDFIQNFSPDKHFVHLSDLKHNKTILEEKGELNRVQEMKKQDGTHFWAHTFTKLNEDKSTLQVILLDITEQVKFQEALELKVKERTLELTDSLKREKEYNEMKSRFVSMASHEFRTPLTSILNSATLIEAYSKDEQIDKRNKHIERVKSSVKNLVDIINDYLSIEKLEKGVAKTANETFDLTVFSKDLVDEVNGMLKNGQTIQVKHNGEENIVQDKKILRKVCLNLLSNAIKYSGENKEIHLSSEVNKENILLKVKDNGIGIPVEEQKHIFNEYYRATNATNIQGTGLGLIIVKRYIELIGGTINFISKPEEGTTFILTLPQNHSTLIQPN